MSRPSLTALINILLLVATVLPLTLSQSAMAERYCGRAISMPAQDPITTFSQSGYYAGLTLLILTSESDEQGKVSPSDLSDCGPFRT